MANNTESSNSSSSSKKKIATTALAVALAVALMIGGTFSYLSDSSDEVENKFEAQFNSVELTETNGATGKEEVDYDFEIIPGTSETKDPTVTATFTVDSYVFLLVDDDTEDLVTYDIDANVYDSDGNVTTSGTWTLLYSEDDEDNPVEGYAVYYLAVTVEEAEKAAETDSSIKGTATDSDGNTYTYYTQSFGVIKNNTVSYSSTIENSDMVTESTDEDGNTTYTLKSGLTLSFQAYIIQSSPFSELSDEDSVETALLAYLGLLIQYEEGEENSLTTAVNTTIAQTTDNASTSTTFTATIPADTTIVAVDSSGNTKTTDDDGNSYEIETLTLLVESVDSSTSSEITGDTTFSIGEYTYDIKIVDQNGNTIKATSGYIQVDIQIAAGLSNVSVLHSGTSMTAFESKPTTASSAGFYYDSSSGVLSIYTQSFSEYQINWNNSTTNTYIQGTYNSNATSDQTTKVTVNTTIANSASSSDDESYSSSTTFTATIPSGTTLSSGDSDDSSDSSISSLYLVVEETTPSTTAVVPGGDAGDYTYEISLVDQDGNSVSATSGYMNVAIAIKSGISSLTVTKKGDTDTTLSTTTATDGSDYYNYDSSTGTLTIYTQSLGEYEISWNDTGLSLSALTTTDELTFTNSSNSKWTFTCVAGVKVNSQYSGNGSTYTKTISYGDWAIEVVMTCDTDISSVFYPIKFTAANSNNYNDMWYTNVAKSYTAGTEVGIIQTKNALGVFQVDEDYSTPICYDLKVGVSPKNVSITGASVTFELRIYENDGTGTEKSPSYSENYIVLDRITVTAN